MDAPPAIVEVYYDANCVPCRRELPVLAEAVKDPALPIRIVILGDEADAKSSLVAASPMLLSHTQFGIAQTPRDVLKEAGDAESILPYARSVTSDGRICARWQGVLSLERLRALIKACR